jgi:hypothetical protein
VDRFDLVDTCLSPTDLIKLCRFYLSSINGVNKKGYITPDIVKESNAFLQDISKYLKTCGYEEKLLGVNQNTFTF